MAVTPKDNPADLQLAMDRYLAGNMSDGADRIRNLIVGNPETASSPQDQSAKSGFARSPKPGLAAGRQAGGNRRRQPHCKVTAITLVVSCVRCSHGNGR